MLFITVNAVDSINSVNSDSNTHNQWWKKHK